MPPTSRFLCAGLSAYTQGLDFRATTLRVDTSHHITVENCRFRYPSSSKRMLRVFEPTDVTRVGRVAEGGPHGTVAGHVWSFTVKE